MKTHDKTPYYINRGNFVLVAFFLLVFFFFNLFCFPAGSDGNILLLLFLCVHTFEELKKQLFH